MELAIECFAGWAIADQIIAFLIVGNFLEPKVIRVPNQKAAGFLAIKLDPSRPTTMAMERAPKVALTRWLCLAPSPPDSVP
jgi:hypothetical protein